VSDCSHVSTTLFVPNHCRDLERHVFKQFPTKRNILPLIASINKNASSIAHVHHLLDFTGNVLPYSIYSIITNNSHIFSTDIIATKKQKLQGSNPHPTKLWKMFVRVQAVGVSKNGILKITKWPMVMSKT